MNAHFYMIEALKEVYNLFLENLGHRTILSFQLIRRSNFRAASLSAGRRKQLKSSPAKRIYKGPADEEAI